MVGKFVMKDRQEFFYWLITICCIVLAGVFAQNAHLWELMNSKDATKLIGIGDELDTSFGLLAF